MSWRRCPYCGVQPPLAIGAAELACTYCDARWPADPSPENRRRVLEHAAYLQALVARTREVRR